MAVETTDWNLKTIIFKEEALNQKFCKGHFYLGVPTFNEGL